VDVIKGSLTVNQFVNRVAEAYFGFKYLILDDIAADNPEAKNPARIKELERIVEMIHGKDYKPEDLLKKLLPHQINMKCLKSCNL
jgi:ferritin-like protein